MSKKKQTVDLTQAEIDSAKTAVKKQVETPSLTSFELEVKKQFRAKMEESWNLNSNPKEEKSPIQARYEEIIDKMIQKGERDPRFALAFRDLVYVITGKEVHIPTREESIFPNFFPVCIKGSKNQFGVFVLYAEDAFNKKPRILSFTKPQSQYYVNEAQSFDEQFAECKIEALFEAFDKRFDIDQELRKFCGLSLI